MQSRRQKRLTNRLAKQGLTFLRWERDDRHLVTILVIIRAILQMHRPEPIARAFTFPRTFLAKSGPRVIADAILAEHARRYATAPGLSSH